MQQAAQWIEEHRRFWEESLDRLGRVFEGIAKRTRKTKPKTKRSIGDHKS